MGATPRFNGAAVRRRRRAARDDGWRPSLRSLQRSRRPKTAESSTTFFVAIVAVLRFNGAAVRRRRRAGPDRLPAVPCPLASTEPPSEDGGERREDNPPARGGLGLQRSRRPKTAERCRRPTRFGRTPRFNGAAVRRRRRGRVRCQGGLGRPALQRSRRPKTAESASKIPHNRARLSSGFNGAAVRRRRRGS